MLLFTFIFGKVLLQSKLSVEKEVCIERLEKRQNYTYKNANFDGKDDKFVFITIDLHKVKFHIIMKINKLRNYTFNHPSL